jgi:hypothetical protein
MKIIVDIPQAVLDHAVHKLAMSHPVAPPGLFQEIRGIAHAFHAARHDDLCITQANSLGRQHDRLQA